MTGSILVVDDQISMTEMIAADLALRGISATTASNVTAARETLEQKEIEVILTDIRMPGTSGLDFCRELSQRRPDVPVIVMTGFGNLETAIAAIRAGAFDFVTKPIELDLLAISVQRALAHAQLHQKIRRLESQAQAHPRISGLIAESPAMEPLLQQLPRIAESEAAVLITGESGTGKELIARAVHDLSRRARGPFVTVNCGAIPEALFESELFGHTRGAFTDAKFDRQGLLAAAEGGTLFLDELGDLPLAMQVKLLRALEERRIRPVGASQEIAIDVRLVAATHRDLEEAIEAGKFREDLFYRVNVIQLELPPLRARGRDILLIAQFLLTALSQRIGKTIQGIAAPAAEKLLNYSWPGNVRELRNVMERAVALAAHDQILVDDLPPKVREHSAQNLVLSGSQPDELVPLEQIERQYIRHVLDSCHGNKTMAAKILGLDRKTLYRKLGEGPGGT